MSGCAEGLCDGSGFLFDDAARVARPCRCRPARLARKRAAALEGRIPRRYREVSFDREPLPSIERANPPLVRAVRRYVADIAAQLDAGRGIWFTGDIGTGKTTIAMLISRAAMAADRTVAIYSLPRLLGVLRDTYDDDARYSLNGLIERLCGVDLLHVDDVGAEQSSPWVLEQLYSIVNTRYEDGRAMLVTTNLITRENDAGLRAQIGDRTVSRLWEMCGEPWHVYGPDQRLPEAYALARRDEGEPARRGGWEARRDDDVAAPGRGGWERPPAQGAAEAREGWDPDPRPDWDDEPPAYGEPRARPARWAS